MANQGEDRLLTLYADIHYWFGQPSARPASHRFDKECYLYLYRNITTNRGRLEIANHAGTPEQDAFEGYLDNAKIFQSFRQPSLVTIVVDGFKSDTPVAAQSVEWRLPSTDPRDEGKYLFRLHTLDMYFWTKEDAIIFVQHCQHVLRPQQFQLDYPVTESHHDVASPVVQKLETMAVSDPAYSADRQAKSASIVPANSSAVDEEKSMPPAYVPLAYNPAAPAAPEKRAHREKTPPPPEEPGVGLAHAASEDYHAPQPGNVPVYHASSSHQSYTGIPTGMHQPYSPSPSSHGISSPPPSAVPTSHAHGTLSKESNHQHTTGQLPLESPTVQILGPNYLTSPTVPLQHIQPQYADYLSQHQSGKSYHPATYYPSTTGDHNIHAQVYIPSEEDGASKPGKPGVAGPGIPGAGRWEQKAEKAEKGLNRLLRKVEKKIG